MLQQPTTAKKFRPGKFRHHLLDERFLAKFSPEILTELRAYLPLWQSQKISSAELAALYILLFLQRHRPDNWWSGRRPSPTPLGTFQPREWLEKDSYFRRVFAASHASTLLEFFSRSHLRGIPASVHASLQNWHEGRYPLQLCFDIPSAREVLQMQAQGRRCVSLLCRPEHMTARLEGERDPLGFLLHDLIHADHFFSKPHMAQQQRGFYRWLWQLEGFLPLQKLLRENAGFKKDFEYISSDMNSHCLHLAMTLKAKIYEAFHYSSRAESFYHELLAAGARPLPLRLQEILRRINTPEFHVASEASPIESYFMELGQLA